MSLLNFSLAILSFSSNGSKPIHLDNNLPFSLSFLLIKLSRFDSVTDIIKSKSSSRPIASLIALLV